MRYSLIFFAAMFLANSTVAVARACLAGLAAQEHTAIQVLGTSGDAHPCPESVSAPTEMDLAHCAQSQKGGQTFFFDAPMAAVAAPLSPHRVWFAVEPRLLVLSLAPSVAGPSLTILFRNFRI
jgi:hypothetical protein